MNTTEKLVTILLRILADELNPSRQTLESSMGAFKSAVADAGLEFTEVQWGEAIVELKELLPDSLETPEAVLYELEQEQKDVAGEGVLDAQDNVQRCSFCGESRYNARKLFAGPGVFICKACIEVCHGILTNEEHAELSPNLRLRLAKGEYVRDVLQSFFAPASFASLFSARALFPIRCRQPLQRAIEGHLESCGFQHRFFGLADAHSKARPELNFAALWEGRVFPVLSGPVQFDLDITEKTLRLDLLSNGLWLAACDDRPVAILLCPGPGGPESEAVTAEFLSIATSFEPHAQEFFLRLRKEAL